MERKIWLVQQDNHKVQELATYLSGYQSLTNTPVGKITEKVRLYFHFKVVFEIHLISNRKMDDPGLTNNNFND